MFLSKEREFIINQIVCAFQTDYLMRRGVYQDLTVRTCKVKVDKVEIDHKEYQQKRKMTGMVARTNADYSQQVVSDYSFDLLDGFTIEQSDSK